MAMVSRLGCDRSNTSASRPVGSWYRSEVHEAPRTGGSVRETARREVRVTLATSVVLLVAAGIAELAGWRSYALGMLVFIPAMLAIGLYTAFRQSSE